MSEVIILILNIIKSNREFISLYQKYSFFHRLSTERLKNLTSDILSIFPTEVREVYYVPFRIVRADGKSIRIHASGKLYEHFLYRKSVLVKAGVIARRRPKKIFNSTNAIVPKLTGS